MNLTLMKEKISLIDVLHASRPLAPLGKKQQDAGEEETTKDPEISQVSIIGSMR